MQIQFFSFDVVLIIYCVWIAALIHDTISSPSSLYLKGLHFVACMDSDVMPLSKPIVSMIQNYIPLFVTVQRQGIQSESESCTVLEKDTKQCWAMNFSLFQSGYGLIRVEDPHVFHVKCQVIAENWFDDESMDGESNVCDYSTHRLEWW